MKANILMIVTMLFFVTVTKAQDEKPKEAPKTAEKSQKEKDIDQSLKNIKKELENIKNNVDSAKLREIAKTLEKSADEIASEMETIADDITEKADKLEDKNDEKADKADSSDKDEAEENKGDIYNKDKKKDKKGKFNLPNFKEKKPKVERRTKTYVEVQTGLNGLQDNNGTLSAGRVYPKVNAWSWYFDYALKWKTRIGGPASPVSINYGLSYLRNNYRFENDARLTLNSTGNPSFETLSNASENPKLTVGYINIPIGIDVKVGKKGRVGVGAYGGYRVTSRQVLSYKVGSEKVEEKRTNSYGLNDFDYGLSAKVGVGGLTLNARYNASSLFKSDNKDYQYNAYMLGVSFGF
jgi:Outer membrane protein beta-barrel domain